MSVASTLDPPTAPSSGRHIDRLLAMDRHPAPNRTIYGDRFIPSRSASNFALFGLPPPPPSDDTSTSTPYARLLREALFGHPASQNFSVGDEPPSRNIFRFKSETRRPMHSLTPFRPDEDDDEPAVSRIRRNPTKGLRRVPGNPDKVLDAPQLQDDFYMNVVDWSSDNVLAVGLGRRVYLYNAGNNKVVELRGSRVDVRSVGWSQCGATLAVGTQDGKVEGLSSACNAKDIRWVLEDMPNSHRKQIWDASRCKRVRTMDGHRSRVGALAWSSSTLSSGSHDRSILQRDVRAQDNYVSRLTGHSSEVCGLKWSCDNRELASGGDDNKVFVWNQNSTQPVLKFNEHTGAVKAIAWSPHLYRLLASGGGSSDRCIRFWNTATNSRVNCMDTGSQVCNLAWSKNVNELVSTHGYSQNEIVVWKYPSLSKVATLKGHTSRVLHLALSPDGQKIATGSGDETLRLWNVFPPPKSQHTECNNGISYLGRAQIR